MKNIAPCRRPIKVSFTYPSCIGQNDKIRLYSIVRDDVTSADPPTTARLVENILKVIRNCLNSFMKVRYVVFRIIKCLYLIIYEILRF